jgi:methylglyoxal synthase
VSDRALKSSKAATNRNTIGSKLKHAAIDILNFSRSPTEASRYDPDMSRLLNCANAQMVLGVVMVPRHAHRFSTGRILGDIVD